MPAKKQKRQPKTQKKQTEKPVIQVASSTPENKIPVAEFDFFLPYCGVRRQQ